MEGTPRRLTFEYHRRELGSFRYVYPVLSRRARGVSVGINLNPDKGCNFDCLYCQVDRTGERPKPGVDLAELEVELRSLLSWAVAGCLEGEPNLQHEGTAGQRIGVEDPRREGAGHGVGIVVLVQHIVDLGGPGKAAPASGKAQINKEMEKDAQEHLTAHTHLFYTKIQRDAIGASLNRP